MEIQGVLLLSLDRTLVHQRYYLPAFRQVSLHGERHCESQVSCLRTQHRRWPGLEAGHLNPESGTLTIRPRRILLTQRKMGGGDDFCATMVTAAAWVLARNAKRESRKISASSIGHLEFVTLVLSAVENGKC